MEPNTQCFAHPEGAIISLNQDIFYCGWGDQLWDIAPSQEGISLYFPDFFLKEQTPWLSHRYHAILTKDQLEAIIDTLPKEAPFTEWSSQSFSLFEEAYQELQTLFQNQKLEKGVPYIFEFSKSQMTLNNIRYLIKALLDKSRTYPLKIYGFWNAQEGILGGTPETLFEYSMNDNQLYTMACAGTSSIANSTFIENPKELKEHNIVIEGIVKALSNFGEVEVKTTEMVDVPNLSHLVTPINVSLQTSPSFSSLVKALHPTPALGAHPRSEGEKWLLNLDAKNPRGRYGAPVGYWDSFSKKGASYVAIRNVQWSQNECFIGAGCGVIPQSILSKEWDEVKLKMSAIKKMLAL